MKQKLLWLLDWLALIGALLCAAVLLAMCQGCMRIPVTVHPPHADDGQPLALPTAPTGRIQNADGTVDRINPAFAEPRPGDHPVPPGMSMDWNLIIGSILTLLTGAGGMGYLAQSRRSRELKQDADEGWDLAVKKTTEPKET